MKQESTKEIQELLESASARASKFLANIQNEDGCWEGEMVWSPIISAQYTIVAYLIGRLPHGHDADALLDYFRYWRNEDGGWGLHAEAPSSLFVTTLVYVAMRMLGALPDSPEMQQTLRLIESLGGAVSIPTWGKLWLAFLNLYRYEGINPILPQLWLLPRSMPGHPSGYYCHTRLIYLAMGYLYGVRFAAPVDDLISSLRDELYEDFDSVEFESFRLRISKSDLYDPPSAALRGVYEAMRKLNRYLPKRLLDNSLRFVLEQVEFEEKSTNFAGISPMNAMLNVLVLHHAGRMELRDKAFEGLDYWRFEDETEGLRYAGARSKVWDTSFVVQAVLASGFVPQDFAEAIVRGLEFLDREQIMEHLPNASEHFRQDYFGGWCFSDSHHRWPVSDTTAEALHATLVAKRAGLVEPDKLRMEAAVRFILERQNPDGGFGSYERRKGPMLLEKINPAEMFANCMVEHSYVECTASSVEALMAFAKDYPSSPLAKPAADAAARGAEFIAKAQNADGSWNGFWGINYTYGTMFAIRGLVAVSPSKYRAAIDRGCDWLIAHQRADGSWGEHWSSALEGRYVEHPEPQVIMSAWAIMGLLLSGDERKEVLDAAYRGAEFLANSQQADGSWPRQSVAGVFFNTSMLHYDLYRIYFPLWALNLAKQRLNQ